MKNNADYKLEGVTFKVKKTARPWEPTVRGGHSLSSNQFPLPVFACFRMALKTSERLTTQMTQLQPTRNV